MSDARSRSPKDGKTYLHAIRIKIPHRRDTARVLNFNQAPLQRLQLVVVRKQRLRDRLRGDHEVVNVTVTAANEVEQRPLHVQLCRAAFIIQEVAVHPALVDFIELPLVVVKIGLAQRPCLRDRKLLEVVADTDELIIRGSEIVGNSPFSTRVTLGKQSRASVGVGPRGGAQHTSLVRCLTIEGIS